MKDQILNKNLNKILKITINLKILMKDTQVNLEKVKTNNFSNHSSHNI
jgi:hypothetical protein